MYAMSADDDRQDVASRQDEELVGAELDLGSAVLAVEHTVADGDVFTVKDKNGQLTAWTFVGSDTLLGVLGPSASKDAVVAAAKGTSALKTSQTFVEMYSKINTKESLWLLINGNAPFMAKAASAAARATSPCASNATSRGCRQPSGRDRQRATAAAGRRDISWRIFGLPSGIAAGSICRAARSPDSIAPSTQPVFSVV